MHLAAPTTPRGILSTAALSSPHGLFRDRCKRSGPGCRWPCVLPVSTAARAPVAWLLPVAWRGTSAPTPCSLPSQPRSAADSSGGQGPALWPQPCGRVAGVPAPAASRAAASGRGPEPPAPGLAEAAPGGSFPGPGSPFCSPCDTQSQSGDQGEASHCSPVGAGLLHPRQLRGAPESRPGQPGCTGQPRRSGARTPYHLSRRSGGGSCSPDQRVGEATVLGAPFLECHTGTDSPPRPSPLPPKTLKTLLSAPHSQAYPGPRPPACALRGRPHPCSARRGLTSRRRLSQVWLCVLRRALSLSGSCFSPAQGRGCRDLGQVAGTSYSKLAAVFLLLATRGVAHGAPSKAHAWPRFSVASQMGEDKDRSTNID